MTHPCEVLNQKQLAAIRWLAEHRSETEEYGYFDRDAVLVATGLSIAEYQHLISELESFGAIAGAELVDGDGSIEVRPDVWKIVHQIDNPPPRDYLANAETWIRSRWWSLIFFGILVGLPLLVQWVEMIKTVLAWFGIK